MTKRITASHKFCNVGNRKVDLKFAAGDISSDGGVLLIKEKAIQDRRYHHPQYKKGFVSAVVILSIPKSVGCDLCKARCETRLRMK